MTMIAKPCLFPRKTEPHTSVAIKGKGTGKGKGHPALHEDV